MATKFRVGQRIEMSWLGRPYEGRIVFVYDPPTHVEVGVCDPADPEETYIRRTVSVERVRPKARPPKGKAS